MIEDRKHTRVRLEVDLAWAIESQGLSGRGQLVDVGVKGARIRIEQAFVPKGHTLFSLHASEVPALPTQAKLRWFRRLRHQPADVLCGVTFLESRKGQNAWTEWLDAQLVLVNRKPA
jgi:hypothetical protein